eukprot:TRINITY_DN14467_c0_g1_i1.p1 TRINITY_DN14467_c0_g1~~TRINITY_DN14467_c0_g1_i1.p1  ORF type:complete len:658 (+),score=220.37 TRINITY_DN14467_c0_g1_i1:78-2051(+)
MQQRDGEGDEAPPSKPTPDQKIADERDSIWDRIRNGRDKKGRPRWEHRPELLAKLEEFFTVQYHWYYVWRGQRCMLPGEIGSTVERAFQHARHAALEIPASAKYRLGRMTIDFTAGTEYHDGDGRHDSFGQITLEHFAMPPTARDGTITKSDRDFGATAFPPTGTFELERKERNDSGNFFKHVVRYFIAVFKLMARRAEAEHCAEQRPDDGSRPTQLKRLQRKVRSAAKSCREWFHRLHRQYVHVLLHYKFPKSNSRDELIFFEELYKSTLRILRRYFRNQKLHPVIDDMVNELFRSGSFKFDFKRQEQEWDELRKQYLQGNDWVPEAEAEAEGDPGSPASAGSPTGAAPAHTASPAAAHYGRGAAHAERKFAQLVRPPRRVLLSRAMQQRSPLVLPRFPDKCTSVSLLAKELSAAAAAAAAVQRPATAPLPGDPAALQQAPPGGKPSVAFGRNTYGARQPQQPPQRQAVPPRPFDVDGQLRRLSAPDGQPAGAAPAAARGLRGAAAPPPRRQPPQPRPAPQPSEQQRAVGGEQPPAGDATRRVITGLCIDRRGQAAPQYGPTVDELAGVASRQSVAAQQRPSLVTVTPAAPPQQRAAPGGSTARRAGSPKRQQKQPPNFTELLLKREDLLMPHDTFSDAKLPLEVLRDHLDTGKGE